MGAGTMGLGTGRPIPLDVDKIWKRLLRLQQNYEVDIGYVNESKNIVEWDTSSREQDHYIFVLGVKDGNDQTQIYGITRANDGMTQVKKLNMDNKMFEHYMYLATMVDFDDFIANLHLHARITSDMSMFGDSMQSTALVHRCVRLLGARLARIEQGVANASSREWRCQ